MFSGGVTHIAFGAVFTGLLVAICVTDVRSRRIPNALVLGLLIGGFAFAFMVGGWAGAVRSVIGLVLGFSIWIVFYVGGVLGAGDVKLAAAVGVWLGGSGIWRASLVAALVGGALAIATLVRERRAMAVMRRMATGAATGSLALLTATDAGGSAEQKRVNRPLPYGVALAAGALAIAWIPGLLR